MTHEQTHERPASQVHSTFSIWFYIGILLTIYGALILGAGIWQIDHPVTGVGGAPLAEQNLHAGIWWGAVLLIVGLIYLAVYRPKRR